MQSATTATGSAIAPVHGLAGYAAWLRPHFACSLMRWWEEGRQRTIRRLAWTNRAKYCDGCTILPGKSLFTAGVMAW